MRRSALIPFLFKISSESCLKERLCPHIEEKEAHRHAVFLENSMYKHSRSIRDYISSITVQLNKLHQYHSLKGTQNHASTHQVQRDKLDMNNAVPKFPASVNNSSNRTSGSLSSSETAEWIRVSYVPTSYSFLTEYRSNCNQLLTRYKEPMKTLLIQARAKSQQLEEHTGYNMNQGLYRQMNLTYWLLVSFLSGKPEYSFSRASLRVLQTRLDEWLSSAASQTHAPVSPSDGNFFKSKYNGSQDICRMNLLTAMLGLLNVATEHNMASIDLPSIKEKKEKKEQGVDQLLPGIASLFVPHLEFINIESLDYQDGQRNETAPNEPIPSPQIIDCHSSLSTVMAMDESSTTNSYYKLHQVAFSPQNMPSHCGANLELCN